MQDDFERNTGFFFFMRSAPWPSCGSNGIQMLARGWPTGGRHRRRRPAGSVLKLVHHITVPHMPCLGPLSVSVCVCVCSGHKETGRETSTPELKKRKTIPQVPRCLDQWSLSVENVLRLVVHVK